MNFLFRINSRKKVVQTIRHILIDGSKILLIFTIVEGVIRTAAPQYLNNIHDHEFTGGHAIARNKDGFRSELLPTNKSDGEFRILAVGDSTTFGSGISREATWSAQLVDLLRQQNVEATHLNTGTPGRDLQTINQGYNEHWSPYDPDVVILAVTNNMVSLSWINQDKEPKSPVNQYQSDQSLSHFKRLAVQVNRFSKKFAVFSWISINSKRALYILGINSHRIDPNALFGPLLAFDWKQADVDPKLSEKTWTLFEQDLTTLRNSVSADGRKFVVVYIPVRFMAFDGFFDNEKRVPLSRINIDPAKRLEQICHKLEIPYLNGVKPLRSGRQTIAEEKGQYAPMYNLFDYLHLNPIGNRTIAQALANQLPDLLPKPFLQSDATANSQQSL